MRLHFQLSTESQRVSILLKGRKIQFHFLSPYASVVETERGSFYTVLCLLRPHGRPIAMTKTGHCRNYESLFRPKLDVCHDFRNLIEFDRPSEWKKRLVKAFCCPFDKKPIRDLVECVQRQESAGSKNWLRKWRQILYPMQKAKKVPNPKSCQRNCCGGKGLSRLFFPLIVKLPDISSCFVTRLSFLVKRSFSFANKYRSYI